MAGWLKPLLLSSLLALLAHALGLWFVAGQMPTARSILEEQNDPMFTRTITAASTQAEIAPKAPSEVESSIATGRNIKLKRANSVPKTTVTQSVQPALSQTLPEAQTLSAAAPESASLTTTVTEVNTSSKTETSPQATTTVAQASVTSATAASTASASNASQTLTAQPAGTTDSLLVTGEWPGDTRVNYRLSGYFTGELHGDGRVQWTRSGDKREKYQVRVEARIPGLYKLSITSQGRVSAQGLLPQAFEEKTERFNAATRLRSMRMEDNDIVLENGSRVPRPAASPLAVQDSVSQFIELGHRFSQGKETLAQGQVVRVWLARPGGMDEWVYDVGAEESIFLPKLGQVRVHNLKPRPIPNPRGPFTMQMWLAPSLQYLPAKIRINMGPQDFIELTAEQIMQN